jgi:hypothetical protein
MPIYQCCFLDENEEIVQTQVLGSRDERDARREVMTLMMRVGRFSGYELWGEGRKIAEYKPVKETKVRALDADNAPSTRAVLSENGGNRKSRRRTHGITS